MQEARQIQPSSEKHACKPARFATHPGITHGKRAAGQGCRRQALCSGIPCVTDVWLIRSAHPIELVFLFWHGSAVFTHSPTLKRRVSMNYLLRAAQHLGALLYQQVLVLSWRDARASACRGADSGPKVCAVLGRTPGTTGLICGCGAGLPGIGSIESLSHRGEQA